MLEITAIKKNSADLIQRLAKRGVDFTAKINAVLSLNKKRIDTQQSLDAMLAESNKMGQLIGELIKSNKTLEINTLKKKAAIIKSESKELIELST